MNAQSLLLWVEQSGVSQWIREAPTVFAFPTILTFHTLGMGFLAGMNAAMDLRILGFAPRLPLAPMKKLFPLMWSAFCVSAASGIGLLIAYPTKALTNPVFYIKLVFVGLALVDLRLLKRHVFRDPALVEAPLPMKSKALAGASLLCWVVVITAGRLLAYTYTRMYATEL